MEEGALKGGREGGREGGAIEKGLNVFICLSFQR